MNTSENRFIVWVDDLDDNAISIAGSKVARLGELQKMGIKVPDGFVVTTDAFYITMHKGAMAAAPVGLFFMSVTAATVLREAICCALGYCECKNVLHCANACGWEYIIDISALLVPGDAIR